MENLEVLELSKMSFQSLPKSLGRLTKLHTLLFCNCKLPADMSIIGELKSLKILSFYYSDMVELPKEIGQLANLKVLEINQHRVIILREDLLRLSKLEEIYITCLGKWKTVEEGKEITKQETIDKLKCFSNLQILNIDEGRTTSTSLKKFDEGWNCLLDLVVSTSLKKFDMSIGGVKFGYYTEMRGPNQLEISSTEMRCFRDYKWFKMLLKKTTSLSLTNVVDLDKLFQLRHISEVATLPQLQKLQLIHLPKLTHVWPIQKSPEGGILQGFQNLKSLVVEMCNSLRSLLSLSMEKLLVKLEYLRIARCERMENVIGGEEREATKDDDELRSTSSSTAADLLIIFPLLVKLILDNLPNLRRFCPQACNVGGSHLKYVNIEACLNFNLEVLFSTSKGFLPSNSNEEVAALLQLETLDLRSLMKLAHVWAIQKSPERGILQGFQNLKSVMVIECDSLKSLLSPSMAKLLVKLEYLHIQSCMWMKKVIGGEEREAAKDNDELHSSSTTVADSLIIFPLLIMLELNSLPNLKSFCPQACNVGGSHLKEVYIADCPNLNLKALPSTFKDFVEYEDFSRSEKFEEEEEEDNDSEDEEEK